MTRFPTPPELVEQIIASGYDGYWSMAVNDSISDGVVTIFFSPDTEEQLAAVLEMAPDGIEANKYTSKDGSEFASLHSWTICYPAKEAQP